MMKERAAGARMKAAGLKRIWVAKSGFIIENGHFTTFHRRSIIFGLSPMHNARAQVKCEAFSATVKNWCFIVKRDGHAFSCEIGVVNRKTKMVMHFRTKRWC